MTISLIYAYWSNQPFGATWCDLPWALRNAGLPERLSKAGHEVLESVVMSEDAHPEELYTGFTLARQVAADVAKARAEGELPIVLCGSCALAALGGVAGLGGGTDTGIAWFDAHPDLNTPETTPSGLFEGMALSVATGHAWRGLAEKTGGLAPASLSHAAFFGVRQMEPAERAVIEQHAIPIASDVAEINQRLAGTARTYVHLDMDVHNGLAVRATSDGVPGGPDVATVRRTLLGIEQIGCLAITGLDPAGSDGARATEIAIGHILALADALNTDTHQHGHHHHGHDHKH